MQRPSNETESFALPDGWFAVAWSSDLETGAVKRARYFDEELVLFRTRSGKAVVLDAYCPHLGAHLGEGGRIMGETVRCPFHGWQFGTDGKCSSIPYCDRIPPRARVRSWPVVERNRMIMVWHHSRGEPPSWEVPDLPELSREGWTAPRQYEMEIKVHMQDMAENNCDPTHFQFVHGYPRIDEHEITIGDDGRFMRVVSHHEQDTPYGQVEVSLERDTWGVGLSSVRMLGMGDQGILLLSSTTAIDQGRTYARWLFTATEELADTAGEHFMEAMTEGVKQDFQIWENKVQRRTPVLCEGDEHLGEFRRWVKQFYSQPTAG